jgi:hypothetical protein
MITSAGMALPGALSVVIKPLTYMVPEKVLPAPAVQDAAPPVRLAVARVPAAVSVGARLTNTWVLLRMPEMAEGVANAGPLKSIPRARLAVLGTVTISEPETVSTEARDTAELAREAL